MKGVSRRDPLDMLSRLGGLQNMHGNSLYPLLEEPDPCEPALSHADFHKHYGGDNLERGQRTDDVVTIRGVPHLTHFVPVLRRR